MDNQLDYLGKLLMIRFRDVAFECIDGLCENNLTRRDIETFRKCFQRGRWC